METIWQSGIQFIIFLQNLGDWLFYPMRLFSFLGDEYFLLFFAPIILWCLDYSLGLRLGVYFMLSSTFNGFIKTIFHMPRPYWISSQVKVYIEEISFGLPSGHAQNTFVYLGVLAKLLKKTWIWIVLFILALGVGLSRMYLGVHFPTDVLGGWISGLIFLLLLLWVEKPLLKWFRGYSISVQLLLVITLCLALILTEWGTMTILQQQGWVIPPQWLSTANITGEKFSREVLGMDSIISKMGTFLGLVSGAILFFNQSGFDAGGTWWKRLLRFLVGMCGVLVIYFGLKVLFAMIASETDTILYLVLRFIRYTLVGLWVTGIAPWIFIQSHLSKKRVNR